MVLPLIGKLLGDRRVRLEVGVGGWRRWAPAKATRRTPPKERQLTYRKHEEGWVGGVAVETGRQRWRWGGVENVHRAGRI